jgi:hypothetical protein
MATFVMRALDAAQFAPLFALDTATLAARAIVRQRVDADHGTPCRVSLEDARRGEEVLLLSHTHHPAASPYRASGPLFVRRYAGDGTLLEAEVCAGTQAAGWLHAAFARPALAYVHLHFARHGCYACAAVRAD